MFKGSKHIIFKKGLCCLVFLFSFLISFSSIHQDRHIYQQISDESSIDAARLDYSEFSLTSQSHLSESPENPAEGENNFETEKESENETDDDKDESLSDAYFHDIVILDFFFDQESYSLNVYFSKGTFVPYYILFHSWKSYLA